MFAQMGRQVGAGMRTVCGLTRGSFYMGEGRGVGAKPKSFFFLIADTNDSKDFFF